jgi:hypothetical protein
MVTRSALADLTEARLRNLNGPAGYRGLVPATPPTISVNDLRVRAYWVLWAGAGAGADERLGGDRGGKDWSFQVTCVAGIEDHLPQLVDDVHGLLEGWRPVDDPNVGRCWPPLGYDPGPPRPDNGKTPVRYVVPLRFVISI